MALTSRRTGTFVAITALAVLGSVATPLTSASAADPIDSQSPPTLTAPANNTTTAIKDVVLSWTAVSYATRYQIQMSPNAAFTNNLVSLPNAGKTVNTTYEVPLSLPFDEYFWRVRALDANGHTGWSTARAFLHEWDSPLSLLTTPTGSDPTISWTPVPEASLYRVRYSTRIDFPDDADLTATCFTANTSFTPYTLASAGERLDGSCMTATDFRDGVQLYYEVTAYDDSTAAVMDSQTSPDPNWNCGTAQPACDGDRITGGPFTYTAPTAGSVADGDVTGMQTTWHTATGSTACDDTNACQMTPTFSWTPVSGANWYRVAIYRDPELTNVYRVYDTSWPSVTPRDALFDSQAGRGYYWTVMSGTCVNSDTDATCGTPVVTGKDVLPSTGDTSPPQIVFFPAATIGQFAKQSGTVPLTSPNNGAMTSGTNVTFQWGGYAGNGGQDAYDARNYRLQVATDDGFDNVVWDFSDIDMSRFTNADADLADGVYFWRVQAIDESGNHLDWSATRTFSRDGSAPTLKLTDANGVAVNGKLHVSASESDLVGSVDQSSVHVIPVVGGGFVAGSWNQNNLTHWTFTPSAKLVTGQRYALAVLGGVSDEAGNAAVASSRSVRTSLLADDKGPAWHFTGTWVRHSSSAARHGTYKEGNTGAAATLKVVGKSLQLVGCKGPAFGKLVVRLDGVVKKTINEHQSFTQCGVGLWSGSMTATAVHTLKLTVSSKKATVDQVRVG